MIDTSDIRMQLLKLAREATDERVDKLAEDVMELCNEYDRITQQRYQVADMERIIAAGEQSLSNSFQMIESLRKSL
jgi:hypothetical protein